MRNLASRLTKCYSCPENVTFVRPAQSGYRWFPHRNVHKHGCVAVRTVMLRMKAKATHKLSANEITSSYLQNSWQGLYSDWQGTNAKTLTVLHSIKCPVNSSFRVLANTTYSVTPEIFLFTSPRERQSAVLFLLRFFLFVPMHRHPWMLSYSQLFIVVRAASDCLFQWQDNYKRGGLG